MVSKRLSTDDTGRQRVKRTHIYIFIRKNSSHSLINKLQHQGPVGWSDVRGLVESSMLQYLAALYAGFVMLFQCRSLYSFVVYLYVNGSGSITSVGEERANLSAVVYL